MKSENEFHTNDEIQTTPNSNMGVNLRTQCSMFLKKSHTKQGGAGSGPSLLPIGNADWDAASWILDLSRAWLAIYSACSKRHVVNGDPCAAAAHVPVSRS